MSWWSWKARAARRRSTCAPATSPTWASPRPLACPVVLAGDIDRGGVIAQIVGTQAVLDPDDAARIEGFLINRFRGDPRLFDDGYARIAAQTGWRGFGVLPWFADALAATGGGCAGPRRAGAAERLSHRLPRTVADREFRRSRPAEAGAGRAADHAGPGACDPRRCGSRDPAGDEIDARRSGLPAGAGLGHRPQGACPARWSRAGHLRRLPDAGAAWWTTPRGSRGRRGQQRASGSCRSKR